MARRLLREAAEDHPVEGGRLALDVAGDGAHRDLRRRVGRIAVDAGRDRRKGDGPEAVLAGEVERGGVGRRQELRLAGAAALPARPDGVDDVARRQVVAAGDARIARRAAADPLALLLELGPGGAMDGPVDAAAAEKALIGGVDDGVGLEPRDVADHDLEPGRADDAFIHGGQGRAAARG